MARERATGEGDSWSAADASAALLALKHEYLTRAGKISADIGERLPADSEERATVLENSDVQDALRQEALDEVAKVDAALARLQAGHYGECVACGEQIDSQRLRAYPAAVRCIDCKRALENS
jgi:DnaK suppressor protein